METILRDLRHGVRLLWKQPSFTLAALAVLALGIGANSAMFSLVNSFLLKPLVIQKPDELVGVYTREAQKPDSFRGFSYPEYQELRAGNTVFSSVMAHNPVMVGMTETGGDATRRVFADMVSANYFTTFGVPLFRGREFTADEERPGSALPVVIVSHPLWKRLGSDPDFVGKTLRINARVFTVVGIAPPGFTGTTALISFECYLPLGMYEAVSNNFDGGNRALSARDNFSLILVGRLRPGLTREAADSQLAATAARMPPATPVEGPRALQISPLSRLSISTQPSPAGELRLPSLLLQSMAVIVLLIASLNVANMMLARGSVRRREIAIRIAMGASRRSVLVQLFTEGFLLACLGGIAGLAVAYWGTTALVRSLASLAPLDIAFNATPDARILAATLGFCLLSTVLFALAPALSLSRPDVFGDLKGKDAETASGTGGRRGLLARRNLMVIAQLALSLTLLTAAGLFLHSSLRAAAMAPGFDVDGGLIVESDPGLAGYDEAQAAELNRRLLARLQAIPGVESAGMAATVPFGMVSLGRNVQRASDPAPTAGASDQKAAGQSASYNIVSPDYFKTLGIHLLRGRTFSAGETHGGTSRVVIVNQLLAEQLWPDGDPIGQRVRLASSGADRTPDEAEVVGVVAPVQLHVLGKAYESQVYVPAGQATQTNMSFHLRSAARTPEAAAALLETVRREIRATDSRLPVLALRTLRDHLERSFDFWLARTAAVMFSLFGGVALIMAVIGLYGVRAYSVSRRTREIGIRLAIGASARDTLGMVLREGLALTAIGLGVGLLLALALGKVLSGMLYQVSGVDPLTFAGASLLLGAVSLLACWVPAQRAARIEPMVALRHE